MYFVSHTGEYFVSGSKDHTARVWCTDRVYPVRTLTGHNADVDVSTIVLETVNWKPIC